MRRWREALHANNLDGEMMTAVLNAHRRLVGATPEAAAAAARLLPLSQMTAEELHNEAMVIGFDVTVENLRTRLQLQETRRPTRPVPHCFEIPDFSKMPELDLISHCQSRGIEVHGLSWHQMRLALQNWHPTSAAGMESSMAASSTTGLVPSLGTTVVPMLFHAITVPETQPRAPTPVPTSPWGPRTPPMTRRSSSVTPDLAARTPRQLVVPLLRCPIHQCPLIMTENPVDRSLFLACDEYPDCRVIMPPWKAPPPKAPPLASRGPSVSVTTKAPPGFLPRVIAQPCLGAPGPKPTPPSPPPPQASPPHREPYAKAPSGSSPQTMPMAGAPVDHGHHLVVPGDADDV